MKPVPLLSLVGVLFLFIIISIFSVQLSTGLNVIRRNNVLGKGKGDPSTYFDSRNYNPHKRVKRQLVAYQRLETGEVLPVLGNRRNGHGGSRSAEGEDGSDISLFKSAGVGYEHRHNERCEESKCGYNIRHCPHGCVFNSFTCGGGAAYDTCCC